jgi:hypothetical protein
MSLNGSDPNMAAAAWADVDADADGLNGFVQQSPVHSHAPAQPSHEDQLDRQMLRHLLRKYTTEDLARLMQEENPSSLPGMRKPCRMVFSF